MELFKLTYDCMVITKANTRCKQNGNKRYEFEGSTYAVCGNHLNRINDGADVKFALRIQPEVIAVPRGQMTLTGMSMASEAKANINKEDESIIKTEIFYVKGLSKDGNTRRVSILHHEVIDMHHEFVSMDLPKAIKLMPNVEGRVTGILIRQGDHKMAFNRRGEGGWSKINLQGLSIMMVSEPKDRHTCPKCSGKGKLTWGITTNATNGDRGCFDCNGLGYYTTSKKEGVPVKVLG